MNTIPTRRTYASSALAFPKHTEYACAVVRCRPVSHWRVYVAVAVILAVAGLVLYRCSG